MQKRFSEMYPKGGFNQQDQMALEQAIRSHEHLFAGFAENLRTNASVLGTRARLFGETRLSEAELRADAAGLMARMQLRRADLQRITLRPSRTFAERAVEKLGELEHALQSRDRNGAQDAAIRLNVVAKFHAAQVCFDRIRQFVGNDERVPVKSIRDFVCRLNHVCLPLQLFPERIVPGYETPFQTLEAGLRALQEKLEQHPSDDADLGARSALYKEIRAFLDGFDLEAMVRELP